MDIMREGLPDWMKERHHPVPDTPPEPGLEVALALALAADRGNGLNSEGC